MAHMPARPPPWNEHLRMADGRTLWIRPIEPADAEPLRAGFVMLKPDEIRHRFLHAVKELSPAMALRFTTPDPDREFALVAAEPLPPGDALVGAVARIAIDDGRRDGEFAILVSHFIGGMGLGRRLMQHLVTWARRRRLSTLYGDVLEHNHAMLRLVESMGFRRTVPPDGVGLVRVVLDLRPPPRKRSVARKSPL